MPRLLILNMGGMSEIERERRVFKKIFVLSVLISGASEKRASLRRRRSKQTADAEGTVVQTRGV